MSKQIMTKYWRAIHQQYKGHIPFEMALKTLMEQDEDFCRALDSIEKCLLVLPQRMKAITRGQAILRLCFMSNYEFDPRRMVQLLV
ncbi:hypothetical protein CRE_14967 [Caenorhabditis remanei]|uniref:Uncharacterized protein n=1 Tax=Caenorhabditis remanei TaxID=31234 RepID=E3NBY9_CAERE|nr:hypothetical protein CRE_14967 [Caenorhabditis remanei]